MSELGNFPAEVWRRDYLLGPDMSQNECDKILQSMWDDYIFNDLYHHNVGHPTWMITQVDDNLDKLRNPRLVGWSVFGHDRHIVPYFLNGENEERSAVSTERDLAGKLPGSEVDLITHYIRRTAAHNLEYDDPDLAFFLDDDMAILGAPKREYYTYKDNIRREVVKATYRQFVVGRIGFLKTAAPLDVQVFSSEWGIENFEAQSHINTGAELAELEAIATILG